MNLKPYGTKVLLEISQPENVTKSGIALSSERRVEGIALVVAIGKDVCAVESGQTVCFQVHTGQEMFHEGKSYRLLDEREIGAIISGMEVSKVEDVSGFLHSPGIHREAWDRAGDVEKHNDDLVANREKKDHNENLKNLETKTHEILKSDRSRKRSSFSLAGGNIPA